MALSACSAFVAPTDEGASSGTASSAPVAASSAGIEGDASSAASLATEARVVRIEATNWAFTPNVITAKVGEKVTVQLVSFSGIHGIAVPELGIDAKSEQEGQTVTFDLPTSKAGTFPFRCNVLCGEGHKNMTGTIVIE